MAISDYANLGSLSLINVGTKHAERLEAHANAEVKARAPFMRASTGELQSAYQARRTLKIMWISASQKRDQADDELDAELSNMSYELLGLKHINKNRKHTDYRLVFPDGNTDFMNGPDRAELAVVGGIVKVLEKNPEHPMATRGPKVAALAATMEASLTSQTTAESAYRAAEALENEKRRALYRALKKSRHTLMGILDGDAKAVDALFPTLPEVRVDEKEEEG